MPKGVCVKDSSGSSLNRLFKRLRGLQANGLTVNNGIALETGTPKNAE
jgi:hypothetical protein